MKIHELIAILEELDPEANVYLGTQPTYPFEHSIAGVAVREDFTEEVDYDDAGEPEFEPGDEQEYGTNWQGVQLAGNDVLIVEGQQTAYGRKDMFDNARRW